MKRTIVTLVAAAAVGMAGLTAAPRSADAQWWVAPVIIGSIVGGVAVGATVANATPYPYDTYGYVPPSYAPAPAGTVYVRPTYAAQQCFVQREVQPNGIVRRVRVCH